MAYNRNNGGNNRVVDFKDGQPVYKRGRSNNRTNAQHGGKGGRSGERGEGEGSERGGNRRYGERGAGQGSYNRSERGKLADRKSYNNRNDNEGFRRSEGNRSPGVRRDEFRRAEGFDENTRRITHAREGYVQGYSPRSQRGYNIGGGRMEDFPHDIPPRREREGGETHGAYREERHEGRQYSRYDSRPAMPDTADAPSAEQPLELPNIIMGRNPVKEAIKAGRSIDRILVTKEHDGSLNEILDLARDAKLVIRDVERAKLDEICMPFGHNGRTGNHQGIIAYIPGVEYCELSDILDRAKENGEPPFVVLLDGIEDPHNLGSIIRSAECAGAHGVVITKRRSASVTAAVVKTSAGATEHIPIAKVVNLSVAIDRLKEAGVWVAGADMDGEPLYSADLKGPFALVVGAEGAGISRLVAEKCDYLVSIPLMGQMESLNASVAAAVIMFEKVRQDKQK